MSFCHYRHYYGHGEYQVTINFTFYKFSPSPTFLSNTKMGTMFGNSLLFMFLLLLFSPVAFSGKCNPQDKKVLLQIKKELNNPYLLASWDPETACCDWYCVECDLETHRIKALIISSSIPDTTF